MKCRFYGVMPVLLLLLTLVLAVPVSAEEVTLPDAYTQLEDCLPDELTELLPDGLFSPDLEEALSATTEMTHWKYLFNTLFSAVGLELEGMRGLLCTLVGVILIAAVCHRIREGLGGSGGEIFGFCLRLALYTATILPIAASVTTVQNFFQRLITLTGGMIPAMGVLYAIGGNVGRAAVSSELLLLFLGVCQYVSATITPPVCALCMSFSLMDALGVKLSLTALGERIKKWYVSILGLVMFLLSLALSGRSMLIGQADTLGMRGIKYAVGTVIPVVGGAVSGTLSTVAVGIGALRGVCGVAGVFLLALLLLPTLVHLLLTRALLNLASTVASLLSCDGEAKLLGEMASLQGYLAAAVSICSVLLVLALTLLIHSGIALG
ncbi:MAG: hypothetical protein IJD38_00325 [Clostridia bacterium]|nr:hypothetical protein [Clostridia bacterium]